MYLYIRARRVILIIIWPNRSFDLMYRRARARKREKEIEIETDVYTQKPLFAVFRYADNESINFSGAINRIYRSNDRNTREIFV